MHPKHLLCSLPPPPRYSGRCVLFWFHPLSGQELLVERWWKRSAARSVVPHQSQGSRVVSDAFVISQLQVYPCAFDHQSALISVLHEMWRHYGLTCLCGTQLCSNVFSVFDFFLCCSSFHICAAPRPPIVGLLRNTGLCCPGPLHLCVYFTSTTPPPATTTTTTLPLLPATFRRASSSQAEGGLYIGHRL